jgi:hypothetical protein
MLAPYVNVADTTAMLNAYPRGSATSGQIAYWNGTRSLTGSSNLTYSSDNITQAKASGDLVNTIGVTSTTDTTARARIALYAGATSSSNANWRTLQPIVFPKNYKDPLFGGSYAAGGGTLFMYGGSDTSNNNMTFALTNTGVLTANFRGSFRWLTSGTNNYTVSDEIARLNRTGFGLKQTNPQYSIDINATDAIRLPVGTTAQRPTGAAGVLRYNSTNTALEYHTGTSWQTVATTASTSPWTSTSTTVYLTGKKVGIGTSSPTSDLHVTGSVSFGQITTINVGTYYVDSYENWFICTYSGNTTIYLPDPTTCVGRILHFVNRAAYARNTDALLPEVVPLAGGSAGTSILPATAGKWVTLVSDGTYWQTVEGN